MSTWLRDGEEKEEVRGTIVVVGGDEDGWRNEIEKKQEREEEEEEEWICVRDGVRGIPSYISLGGAVMGTKKIECGDAMGVPCNLV